MLGFERKDRRKDNIDEGRERYSKVMKMVKRKYKMQEMRKATEIVR